MGVDDLLERSRAGLERLTPEAARAAVAQGAVIVDTRPIDQRREQGVVPGAVVVCRNVLEWRADGASGHPDARLVGRELIVMCAQGFASSLAAASLQQAGLRATDMVGGFEAWRDAGLPVQPCTD
ncbi:MAG TPA: rhodanese-like domain-containing protein [Gaiellales bacterium]|nr:rhodanese-like domain-containing protein [Gaiellales bacterium]